jgi:hypothetical protein
VARSRFGFSSESLTLSTPAPGCVFPKALLDVTDYGLRHRISSWTGLSSDETQSTRFFGPSFCTPAISRYAFPFQAVLRLPDVRLQLYYIAIVSVVALWSGELLTRMQVTNVVIRFVWVIYIPQSGPNFVLRSFIAATLEMLRRWQWNFCGFRVRPIVFSTHRALVQIVSRTSISVTWTSIVLPER